MHGRAALGRQRTVSGRGEEKGHNHLHREPKNHSDGRHTSHRSGKRTQGSGAQPDLCESDPRTATRTRPAGEATEHRSAVPGRSHRGTPCPRPPCRRAPAHALRRGRVAQTKEQTLELVGPTQLPRCLHAAPTCSTCPRARLWPLVHFPQKRHGSCKSRSAPGQTGAARGESWARLLPEATPANRHRCTLAVAAHHCFQKEALFLPNTDPSFPSRSQPHWLHSAAALPSGPGSLTHSSPWTQQTGRVACFRANPQPVLCPSEHLPQNLTAAPADPTGERGPAASLALPRGSICRLQGWRHPRRVLASSSVGRNGSTGCSGSPSLVCDLAWRPSLRGTGCVFPAPCTVTARWGTDVVPAQAPCMLTWYLWKEDAAASSARQGWRGLASLCTAC